MAKSCFVRAGPFRMSPGSSVIRSAPPLAAKIGSAWTIMRGVLEECSSQVRPAFHEAEEERSRSAADVDDRAYVEELSRSPKAGRRPARREPSPEASASLSVSDCVQLCCAAGSPVRMNVVRVYVRRPDRGQELVRAAHVAGLSLHQELGGFGAVRKPPFAFSSGPAAQRHRAAETDDWHRRKVEQAGPLQSNRLGDRSEQVELHPRQQREGRSDGVLEFELSWVAPDPCRDDITRQRNGRS